MLCSFLHFKVDGNTTRCLALFISNIFKMYTNKKKKVHKLAVLLLRAFSVLDGLILA